ncbi:ABC transporter permease [Phycisphaerales bacterium ac7]|nr:ABC transporter permease [bacterium]
MKTWALFVDAYRELNSKKLFWITMILSGLVVAIFGAIGLRPNGIGILWFTIPSDVVNSELVDAATFYKSIFTGFGVRFWLSIIATVLALVTTAGMIPDFISGGSIELMLSKPVSRTRLYLTKFATGLLFVGLQVGVFSVASMLVIGIRGGVWEPGILLAIPIVVLFYSYLFSVCALIGLVTRSTLAALLLTVLLWFVLFLLNSADETLLLFKTQTENRVVQQSSQLETQRDRLVSLRSASNGETEVGAPDANETAPEEDETGGFLGRIGDEFREGQRIEDMDEEDLASQIERLEDQIRVNETDLEETEAAADSLAAWHGRIVAVKTVLPKTRDTLNLLDRYLISDQAIEESGESRRGQGNDEFNEAGVQMTQELRDRSIWWVIGTSLIFEAFILALGSWIFSRRDF